MVESAATNLVSYLNAPQMHPHAAAQMLPQAGYFELIKRAFHKFTVSSLNFNKLIFWIRLTQTICTRIIRDSVIRIRAVRGYQIPDGNPERHSRTEKIDNS